MHIEFDHLISLLEEEAELYRALLSCIENEKQAIVEMNFDRLADIGKQKENMIRTQRKLAHKRDQAMRQMTDEFALVQDEMTLDRLSQKAPSPYSDRLQHCRGQLRSLAASLMSENDHVQHLVKHGLAMVRESYQMIARILDVNPIYRASGNLRPAASTGRFHKSDF